MRLHGNQVLLTMNGMPGKLSFDDLDLREEPAVDRTQTLSRSNTFKCTATDACSNGCGGTRYCN